MPFQIRTTRHFSAAHQLRLYDNSLEPTHGHNWKVEVTVESPVLDSIGVVMDFHELERLLDAIIQPMHNRHLNEVVPFDRLESLGGECGAAYRAVAGVAGGGSTCFDASLGNRGKFSGLSALNGGVVLDAGLGDKYDWDWTLRL